MARQDFNKILEQCDRDAHEMMVAKYAALMENYVSQFEQFKSVLFDKAQSQSVCRERSPVFLNTLYLKLFECEIYKSRCFRLLSVSSLKKNRARAALFENESANRHALFMTQWDERDKIAYAEKECRPRKKLPVVSFVSQPKKNKMSVILESPPKTPEKNRKRRVCNTSSQALWEAGLRL